MHPTRLIANIINALFTVFPKLGKKINKQGATRMLTMMTVSGMIGSSFRYDDMRNAEYLVEYVDYMIRYNDDVRSIARFVGIQPDLAVDFVRSCFNTNKPHGGLYPYTPSDESVWCYHKHLVTKFDESIAGYITESMIGVIPAHRITEHFGVLNCISRNMAQASNAKLFILEGCSYVNAHEDQQHIRAPGQAEMIFIDEFINYLREFDGVRFIQFQDEIATLLTDIQSPFMPDCSVIINHLDMTRFDEDIATVRSSFKKLLKKPKQKIVPISEVESEGPCPDENAAVAEAFAAVSPSRLSQFLLHPNTLPFTLPPGLPASPISLGSGSSPVVTNAAFWSTGLHLQTDDDENEGDNITTCTEDSDQEDH